MGLSLKLSFSAAAFAALLGCSNTAELSKLMESEATKAENMELSIKEVAEATASLSSSGLHKSNATETCKLIATSINQPEQKRQEYAASIALQEKFKALTKEEAAEKLRKFNNVAGVWQWNLNIILENCLRGEPTVPYDDKAEEYPLPEVYIL